MNMVGHAERSAVYEQFCCKALHPLEMAGIIKRDQYDSPTGPHPWWHFAGAVLAVQLLFWLVVDPVLINPETGEFSHYAVTAFEFARLETPDAEGLLGARFEAVPPGSDQLMQTGYYASRTTVSIPEIPQTGVALLDNSGSDNVHHYVNGHLLDGDGRIYLPDITYHGLRKQIIHIPAPMLTTGDNRVEAVMVFDLSREAGRHPPLLGDYQEFSAVFGWKNFLLRDGRVIAVTIGFALALFTLVALIRAEQRALLAWLFLLSLSWSLRSHFYLWFDMPLGGESRGLYYALVTLALSYCWPMFVDHWSDAPLRWFRVLSTAVFGTGILCVSYWLLLDRGDTAFTHVENLVDGFGLALMALTVARMTWHFATRYDPRHWEAALLIMLSLLMALFLINVLIWERNLPYLTLTQPLFLFAFAIAFFSRNFRLFRSSAQINALLQTELADRTAQLTAAHGREKALIRQEAHNHERQRIMRDMHDGLGSHLMSLLIMARRNRATHEDYAHGIQTVIDEMRLMIDSMDSVGESLDLALTVFQKRMRTRIQDAGLEFFWQTDSPISMPDFGPRDVLQVFRILQEAVSNALKHAHASRIDVHIEPSADPRYAVRLTVSDNGAGPATLEHSGRGLGNMRARAASIRSRLEIRTGSEGTSVVLDLPPSTDRDHHE